jgi:hypothetical protein
MSIGGPAAQDNIVGQYVGTQTFFLARSPDAPSTGEMSAPGKADNKAQTYDDCVIFEFIVGRLHGRDSA